MCRKLEDQIKTYQKELQEKDKMIQVICFFLVFLNIIEARKFKRNTPTFKKN